MTYPFQERLDFAEAEDEWTDEELDAYEEHVERMNEMAMEAE